MLKTNVVQLELEGTPGAIDALVSVLTGTVRVVHLDPATGLRTTSFVRVGAFSDEPVLSVVTYPYRAIVLAEQETP